MNVYLKISMAAAVGIGTAFLATCYTFRHFTKTRVRKNSIFIIKSLPEIEKSTVRMKDPDRVAFLCKQLMKDGVESLTIISDFDDTITKTHSDGKRCHDSFGIMNHTDLAPEGFPRKMKVLKDKYYPIEHDPKMTFEEKVPFMVEWWSKSLDNIAQAKFTKKDFADIVRASTAKLRDGCDELMKTLNEYDIPLFIFSAGIGDIVEEILHQQSEMLPNVTIVSNYMTYDEKGVTNGYSTRGGVIHAFDKKYTSHLANNESFTNKTKGRRNLIMMGDHLGDLKMIEDAEDYAQVMLKVGFFNHVNSNNNNFQEYMDKFDIVLVEDQTFDVVTALIDKIISFNY